MSAPRPARSAMRCLRGSALRGDAPLGYTLALRPATPHHSPPRPAEPMSERLYGPALRTQRKQRSVPQKLCRRSYSERYDYEYTIATRGSAIMRQALRHATPSAREREGPTSALHASPPTTIRPSPHTRQSSNGEPWGAGNCSDLSTFCKGL